VLLLLCCLHKTWLVCSIMVRCLCALTPCVVFVGMPILYRLLGTKILSRDCFFDVIEGYQKMIQRCQKMFRSSPQDYPTIPDDVFAVGVILSIIFLYVSSIVWSWTSQLSQSDHSIIFWTASMILCCYCFGWWWSSECYVCPHETNQSIWTLISN
jgi:hypothetical protein